MSPVKYNTNEMAYLVRQGQQEVVEEDDGDCNYVILVVISHQWSQRRRRSMLTSIEVLEIVQRSGKKLMNRVKGKGLTDHDRGR